MILDDQTLAYLHGSDFSTGAVINIDDRSTYPDRIACLESLCRGKDIIHLGCADHVPVIEAKREKDLWLHGRLCAVARRCLGVDINPSGIQHMKQLGYTDVICANIPRDAVPAIDRHHWDYLVCGEVLEHIDNPEMFLEWIKKWYTGIVDGIIITVPNALSYQNVTHALHNRECINSDHRYWFTPFTLAKICTRAGIEITGCYLCRPYPEDMRIRTLIRHPKATVRKMLTQRIPVLRNTLVITGNIISSPQK